MDNSNGAPGANTTPADSARRIKDAASQVIDRGRQAAMSKVQEKVHEGADRARATAHNTSEALRRAAADVEQDNSLIGTGLRRFADFIDQTTDRVGGGDLNQMVDGLNSFARRNPALFIGASLAVGFVVARLGRAALESADQEDRLDSGYDPARTTPDVTPGL